MKELGRQRERTGLSWSRTGFLTMLVTLLSIRGGLAHGSLGELCAALLLGALSAVLLYRGHERSRYEDGADEVIALPSRRAVVLTGLVIVVVAVFHAGAVLIRIMHNA